MTNFFQMNAMKSAAVAQKEQMKALDMGQLEDLMDDMADIMADQEEINEMMGQNFAVEFDEEDLMGELAELDEELVNASAFGPTLIPTCTTIPWCE